MKTKPIFLLIAFGLSFFWGCKKLPDYALEPKISVNEVVVFRDYFSPSSQEIVDSVLIKINFEDGDGDLGIPNNQLQSSANNALVNLEIKNNGEFVPYSINGIPLTFNGKFPQLAPSNIKSPIDGVLEQNVLLPHSGFSANDTLRFEIYIMDRSGNSSNTVTTDPFLVKKQ